MAEQPRRLEADAAVEFVAITVVAALLAAEGGAVVILVANSRAPGRVAIAGHPAAVLAGGRTGTGRRATADGTSVDAVVGGGTPRQVDLVGIVDDLLEAAGQAGRFGCYNRGAFRSWVFGLESGRNRGERRFSRFVGEELRGYQETRN
jgi:hypothetical protein